MSNANLKEGYGFWEDMMGKYERSGLKVKEFCHKNSLDFNKFRNWRFRIRRRQKMNKKKTSFVNAFIPLVVKNDPAVNEINSIHTIELKLESSGNISIYIPSQFNPEALGNLFSILRRTEC
jgi:hypothetical protein